MFFPRARLRSTGRSGATNALVAVAAWTLTACGGSGGSGDSGDNAANAPPAQNPSSDLHINTVRDRVIARYTIANLGQDPNVRNIDKRLVDQGWGDSSSGFISNVLGQLSANDRGLHRVMLHTPFGRERPIQFDGYLEAKKMPMLDKVTGTFVEAWRDNVTKPSLGRQIEIIGYIGSPRKDPDSKQILEEQGEEAFFEHAWDAMDPLLQANMSVALDSASGAEKDSITYRFAERLREQGTKVYTEANGRADHTWWFDYPIIVLEKTWQERKGNSDFSSREQLQRELIRIVRLNNGWIEGHPPEDWPDAACRIIAEGDTAAVPGRLLLSPQRTIDGLVECANELRN